MINNGRISPRPTESRIALSFDEMRPGDFHETVSAQGPSFVHRCAGCGGYLSLSLHEVIRDNDGLPHITGPAAGSIHDVGHSRACGANYFVHHGRIEWCA